jgi:hypothetical protein
MLNLKSTAELRAVAARKEFHGDEKKKAVTLRMIFKSLALDVVELGFVSQLKLMFDKNDSPLLSDIEPLHVSRDVENVRALIGGDPKTSVLLPRMRVDSVRLTLLPGAKVDVDLKLKGEINAGLDHLHDFLLDTVMVELREQAPELAAVAA